jgi:hypothetical protein
MAHPLSGALTIRVATSPGEKRAAVVAHGSAAPIDVAVWHPGFPDGVGDIHWGHVRAVTPGLGGRFVGLGPAEGFLPDTDCAGDADRPGVGQAVAVRIYRAAHGGPGGKGPRLTARLTEAEAAAAQAARGVAGLVCRGPDRLATLARRYPAARIATDDATLAARLRAAFPDRVDLVARAFDDALLDAMAALEVPDFPLPQGGALRFWPTPALVAVDVDTGTGLPHGAKTAAHLRFNVELLPELARQIRLRDLSGAILVDFAGLPPRRRAALETPLRAELAGDPNGARLTGFTGLGLAEIVRRRVHQPLHEILASAPAVAARALRSAIAADRPGAALTVRMAPDVAAAYAQDQGMGDGLALRVAGRVGVRADPSLPPGSWRLVSGAVP